MDLAEELSVECFKKGADVLLNAWTDRYYEAFMRYLSPESLREPSVWCKVLAENATAQFWLGAIVNPAIIRRAPPEKLSAADEGEAIAHGGRRVRNLFLGISAVTKPRAEAYGFDYVDWYRSTLAASTVDFRILREIGERISRRLEASENVEMTAPNGTNLKLSIKGRRARINDGIVDDQDIAEGTLQTSLPAGSVLVSADETSANGVFVSDVTTPWAGRTINRLIWEFREGRIARFDGDLHALRLRKSWETATGNKNRIGWITIGLNPKMKMGYTHNEISSGAIGVGLGDNRDLEGNNKSGFSHLQVTAKATMRVDGETVVEKGMLKV